MSGYPISAESLRAYEAVMAWGRTLQPRLPSQEAHGKALVARNRKLHAEIDWRRKNGQGDTVREMVQRVLDLPPEDEALNDAEMLRGRR